MKLAELLIERAEFQRRISEISDRLNKYAIIQEGDEPPVKPEIMLKTVDALHVQLEELICKINKVNSAVEFDGGIHLSDAIVQRDVLRSRRNIYSSLAKAAQIQDSRYSRKEIRFVTTVDVEKVIKTTDHLSKELRVLDSKIQAKNWEIEVT